MPGDGDTKDNELPQASSTEIVDSKDYLPSTSSNKRKQRPKQRKAGNQSVKAITPPTTKRLRKDPAATSNSVVVPSKSSKPKLSSARPPIFLDLPKPRRSPPRESDVTPLEVENQKLKSKILDLQKDLEISQEHARKAVEERDQVIENARSYVASLTKEISESKQAESFLRSDKEKWEEHAKKQHEYVLNVTEAHKKIQKELANQISLVQKVQHDKSVEGLLFCTKLNEERENVISQCRAYINIEKVKVDRMLQEAQNKINEVESRADIAQREFTQREHEMNHRCEELQRIVQDLQTAYPNYTHREMDYDPLMDCPDEPVPLSPHSSTSSAHQPPAFSFNVTEASTLGSLTLSDMPPQQAVPPTQPLPSQSPQGFSFTAPPTFASPALHASPAISNQGFAFVAPPSSTSHPPSTTTVLSARMEISCQLEQLQATRRTLAEKKQDARLSFFQMRAVRFSTGGNCLFGALAKHEYLHKKHYHRARSAVVSWLRVNPNYEIAPGVTLRSCEQGSWDAFVNRMAKDRTMATDTCLFAAAEYYGIQIKVITANNPVVEYKPHGPTKPHVLWLAHDNDHFTYLEHDSTIQPYPYVAQDDHSWYCACCEKENSPEESKCATCGVLRNIASGRWNCLECSLPQQSGQVRCTTCGRLPTAESFGAVT